MKALNILENIFLAILVVLMLCYMAGIWHDEVFNILLIIAFGGFLVCNSIIRIRKSNKE